MRRHMADINTIDEYIALFPEDRQAVLRQVRQTIRAAAPEAEERISYGMPALWQGETLVWFAAMKDHIGLYPTAAGVEAFRDRLSAYKTSKGAIQFPYGKPIDCDLIADITRFRVSAAETKYR